MVFAVKITKKVITLPVKNQFFLQESVRLLKPGGSIFITTQNKTLFSWLACIVIV